MNRAYLGLGTNIGDREGYLRQACEILQNHNQINILKISKVYETKAWGYTEQDDFFNICVEMRNHTMSIRIIRSLSSYRRKIK